MSAHNTFDSHSSSRFDLLRGSTINQISSVHSDSSAANSDSLTLMLQSPPLYSGRFFEVDGHCGPQQPATLKSLHGPQLQQGSLNLGLDASGSYAGANIFLELDASAKTELEVHAVAEVATATHQGSPGSVPASIESPALTQPSITEAPNTTAISMIGSTSSTSTFALSPSVSSDSETSSLLPTSSSAPIFTTTGPRVTDAPSTTFESSSSNPVSTSQVDVDSGASSLVSGCFDISAGFDVNAGADASFFGLFKADKKISLFSKQFNLFKECFGEQANARRGLRTKARFLGRRAGLACSLPGIKPEPLADQVIDADAIKAV
ncbi:hypothetical protein BDN71DRAFT_1514302 [Pleurotus eryngii]|uniref:Uncharacterized protein n=1 Tax=Pleurotus eryngii TaxID=5323 RepID=A0A9P6D160_PLEER|nr:hypothetical protein BDN71DRAFT_1514302 [Pleurotus eryngii]